MNYRESAKRYGDEARDLQLTFEKMPVNDTYITAIICSCNNNQRVKDMQANRERKYNVQQTAFNALIDHLNTRLENLDRHGLVNPLSQAHPPDLLQDLVQVKQKKLLLPRCEFVANPYMGARQRNFSMRSERSSGTDESRPNLRRENGQIILRSKKKFPCIDKENQCVVEDFMDTMILMEEKNKKKTDT